MVEKMQRNAANRTTRFKLNKRTHRLRFKAENEDSVEIVVEPHEKENGRNEHRG